MAVKCDHDRTHLLPGPLPVTGPADAGYPPARRLDLAENIGGHMVADPYRWLEDSGSTETKAWLAGQDALAAGQLAALPAREELAARIGELTATGFVSSPVWRGERCFFLRREPGQEHAALITAAPGEPGPGAGRPGGPGQHRRHHAGCLVARPRGQAAGLPALAGR